MGPFITRLVARLHPHAAATVVRAVHDLDLCLHLATTVPKVRVWVLF